MAKEIKVFSMSVLDLLTCALGGTILVSFLLIVSIQKSVPSGFPYAYLSASAGVWVDVTAAAAAVFPGGKGGPAWKALMAADGPFTETERSAALTAARAVETLATEEVVVQLELHRREPGTPPVVPRGVKPLFVSSTAKAAGADGNQLPRQGARVNSLAKRLGPRRVTVGGTRKLFAAFRLNLAAFQVEPGWYFFRLAVVKRPSDKGGTPPAAAGWLRLDSGGRPGAAWYQTHPEFLEIGPDWPAPRGFQDIQTYLPRRDPGFRERETAAKAQDRMQTTQWPDLYVPEWPTGYKPKGPAAAEFRSVGVAVGGGPATVALEELAPTAKFWFVANSPQPNQTATEWDPFFAVRCRRVEASSGAARFPTFKSPPEEQPGWHQADPADPPAFDDFLPGLRIGSGGNQ